MQNRVQTVKKDRLYKRIEAAFAALSISLRRPLTDEDSQQLYHSITNQFLKVEDTFGNFYLIRINGKLWEPFTREDEAFNLLDLKRRGININVIYIDEQQLFQICTLYDTDSQFEVAHNKTNSRLLLQRIARGIKTFHRECEFKGHYPLPNSVANAFSRVSKVRQVETLGLYKNILSIIQVLRADTKNHVSSHNDLLPSSIYCRNNQIAFVDWEYSGQNHRAYDLALFSIKASLTGLQEKYLVSQYDPNNQFQLLYSVALMKPVVSFLLTLWALGSTKLAPTVTPLLENVKLHLQDAYTAHSARTLFALSKFGVFRIAKPEESKTVKLLLLDRRRRVERNLRLGRMKFQEGGMPKNKDRIASVMETSRGMIDERPAVVSEKLRFGDWDVDAVISKNCKQAVLSIV